MATKEQKCKIKDAAKDLGLTPNDIIAIVKERTGAEKKPAAKSTAAKPAAKKPAAKKADENK